jgi:hypothetical protein
MVGSLGAAAEQFDNLRPRRLAPPPFNGKLKGLAERALGKVSASTTLLSCVDRDRVRVSMSFSVTKHPE